MVRAVLEYTKCSNLLGVRRVGREGGKAPFKTIRLGKTRLLFVKYVDDRNV